MEEMVGSVKDERRSDGVSEQPAEDLQMIDRLEDIAEQMSDTEKRSGGVPEQPAELGSIVPIKSGICAMPLVTSFSGH